MSTKNLIQNEIILRMRAAVGVKTDIKLAELLGYSSTGTISQWRKGNVPDSAISKISEISGRSFDELKYGRDRGKTSRPQNQADQINEAAAEYNGTPIKLDRSEFILIQLFRQLGEENKDDMIDIAAMKAELERRG